MGNETAEKPPPSTAQTLGSDAVTMGASLPIVGPLFAAFGKISSKGKAIVLVIVFLLIVYPLVSLSMALLIISKSPSSVKKGARSFVLSSIGVDDEMIKRLNRSNEIIDASIPLQFTFRENDRTVQRVAADQRITFDAFMRKQHIDTPDCTIAPPAPDDESIGVLTVASLASRADPIAYKIDPTFDELFSIGTFGDDQWKEFQRMSKSGRAVPEHPLKIKVIESTNSSIAPFLRCNRITIDVYMTIFKPAMVRDSK